MSLSFCSFSYFGEFQVEYCVGSNITSCLSGYSAFPYLSYCFIFIRSHIGIIHVFKLYFLFDLKVFFTIVPFFLFTQASNVRDCVRFLSRLYSECYCDLKLFVRSHCEKLIWLLENLCCFAWCVWCLQTMKE